MRRKSRSKILRTASSWRLAIVLFALPLALAIPSHVRAQAVLNKSTIQKTTTYVLQMPNLIIMDLGPGQTSNLVYVQVGNAGAGKAGIFYVRLSLKKKGSTTKTYVEKRVAGLSPDTDIPLYIDIGEPIEGFEIGVFVDARKQIAESEELNCGKMYPSGGTVGLQPCKDF